MKKIYLCADGLLDDAYQLAMNIIESGFKPDFLVGVWRGGTPVGIAVQELLSYAGIETDHIAIRTSSYTGIAQQNQEVRVHGLHYLLENISKESKVLLVDDVFDTGKSIQAILQTMQHELGEDAMPEIKSATVWYKPKNNKTTLTPDFYLHTTDEWIVFPHELEGLTLTEVLENKAKLSPALLKLEKFLAGT